MSAPARRFPGTLAALGLGLALVAGPALAQAPRRAVVAEPLGATLLPTFEVTGVLDAANVATVIVCTNFANAATDLALVVRDFDGTLACSLSLPGLAAQQSATFATRDTSLYSEDRICSPAATVDGGWAVLSASARRHAVACTAQTVATNANGVRSLNRLPLYTAEGALVRDRLFTDGFETGDASRWSSVQPLTGDQLTELIESPSTSQAWIGCRLPLRGRSRQNDGRAV